VLKKLKFETRLIILIVPFLFVLKNLQLIDAEHILIFFQFLIIFLFKNNLKNLKQITYLLVIFLIIAGTYLFYFLIGVLSIKSFLISSYFYFFLIFLFLKKIDINFINILRYSTYILFVIENIVILSRLSTGYFFNYFGIFELYFNSSLWPSLKVNGILNSPILNAVIVCSTFLYSFYFKDKFFFIASLALSFIVPSLKSFLFIITFLLLYSTLEYWFFKKKKLFFILISYVIVFSSFNLFFIINNPQYKISLENTIIIRFLSFKNFFIKNDSIKPTVNNDYVKIPDIDLNQQQIKILIKIKKNDLELFNKLVDKKTLLDQDEFDRNFLKLKNASILSDKEFQFLKFNTKKNSNFKENKKKMEDRVNFLSRNFQYENFFLTMIKNHFNLIPLLHLCFLVYLIYKSIVSITKKKNLETMFVVGFSFSIFISNLLDVWVTSYLSCMYIWILFFYIYFKVNNKNFKSL
jgi:hypothetical protein